MSELEAGLIHDSLGYPEKLFQGGGGKEQKKDRQTDRQMASAEYQATMSLPECATVKHSSKMVQIIR